MFLGVDGNSISAVLVVFPAIGTCEMRTGDKEHSIMAEFLSAAIADRT
jgi:hypothetical protein